ncbi:MAG: hypothetical protein ACOYJO_02560 [Eubacterium sp.]
MKHIEEKNARDFVYSNSDRFFLPGDIKGSLYALVIQSFFINFICVMIKGRALNIGFAADILLVVMIIIYLYALLAWKPEKFSTRFTLFGAIATVFSLMSLLMAFVLVEVAEWPSIFEIAAAAVLFCCTLIIVANAIWDINKGKYAVPKPRNSTDVSLLLTIGGSLGVLTAFIFLGNVSHNAGVSIAFVIFYGLSLLFSYGSVYFLKSILIRRFAIPSDGYEEIIETVLRLYRERPLRKKIGSVIVFCLIIFIYISILLGAYLEP